MKPIEAKNQVRLGLGRVLQLALTGMSFRMFRSSITVAILSLAVAFLVHMLAYGLIVAQTQREAFAELGEGRAMSQIIARLTGPDTRSYVLDDLSRPDGGQHWAEYRRWGQFDEATGRQVQKVAQRSAEAEQYLADLPVSSRTGLLGDATPRQMLDRLTDESQFELFVKRLDEYGVPAPLGSLEAFSRLVKEERPFLLTAVDRIITGHAAAVTEVARAYPGRTPAQLAIDPPADFAQTLQAAGYNFDASTLPALTAFARRQNDLEEMGRRAMVADARAAIARETDIPLKEVQLDRVLPSVDSDRSAAWLAEVLASAGAPEHLDAARVRELAQSYRRQQRLQEAIGGYKPEEAGGGIFGLSERNQWLVGLSFIVCVVGVANAMLMSVTERFTEIATMKCLGAMDRFVMLMFVFEAVIQGVVGGVIGIVLGIALAVFRGFIEYGTLIVSAADALGQVALATALSMLVGVLLAAFAAVGPSWVAARLAPMEAMRVE